MHQWIQKLKCNEIVSIYGIILLKKYWESFSIYIFACQPPATCLLDLLFHAIHKYLEDSTCPHTPACDH